MIFPFVLVSAVLSLLSVLPGAVENPLNALWLLAALPGYTAGLIIVYFALLFLLTLFINPKCAQEKDSVFFRRLTVFSIGVLLKLCRVKITLRGLEKLPAEGKWLFVSNHRSNFDPLIAMWALRKYGIAFITKPENLKIPIAGRLMHKCMCIPIDRENNRSAVKTILKAADSLKKGIINYGIYPEGTRSRMPGLIPFRNGAFQIAARAGAPVVSAVLHGSDMIVKRAPWRSTRVTLEILSVYSGEAVSSCPTCDTGDAVHKEIENRWFELENARRAEAGLEPLERDNARA